MSKELLKQLSEKKSTQIEKFIRNVLGSAIAFREKRIKSAFDAALVCKDPDSRDMTEYAAEFAEWHRLRQDLLALDTHNFHGVLFPLEKALSTGQISAGDDKE